jgi:hypothetical protein
MIGFRLRGTANLRPAIGVVDAAGTMEDAPVAKGLLGPCPSPIGEVAPKLNVGALNEFPN